MLRAAYISKIADKVGDSPQKMMTELGKLQNKQMVRCLKLYLVGRTERDRGYYLFSMLPKEHLRLML